MRPPFLNNSNSSKRRKRRDDGWWIDATTATRRSRARSRSASTTTHAVALSSPEVGSSQHSKRGSREHFLADHEPLAFPTGDRLAAHAADGRLGARF